MRNFTRDRANQTVLGVFVGVFAYCLIVLRTIRGGDDAFVPALAVLVAVLLAFVAVGFFIFFIHHVSASIQASSIIARVTEETLAVVDQLFPDEAGAEAEQDAANHHLGTAEWICIASGKTGYIQNVDTGALLALAREYDAVLQMEKAIGEFVVDGSALVSIAGGIRSDQITRRLNSAFTVGRHRTLHQDAGYGIRQIVDVALKALSPGINDTTTAVNCVDYLGAILARLAGRRFASPYRTDRGKLRLITRGPKFALLLAEALDQIRQNAEGNVAVLVRMLEALAVVASRTADSQRRQVLQLHANLVIDTSERSVASSHDRDTIQTTGRRTIDEILALR